MEIVPWDGMAWDKKHCISDGISVGQLHVVDVSWDGTGIKDYGMGWEGNKCPMDKLGIV